MIMGQETLEPVETNNIGQVKIALSAKTGKWVWVTAKQYCNILKWRLVRLKWEQTRKKGLKGKVLGPFERNNIQTSLVYKQVATTSPKENENSLMILPYIVPHPPLSLGHLIFM